mgnify:CR=1 FL=1
MTHKQAKRQLQHALDNQKTISIPKLKRLMQSMNISLEPSKDKEVKYLKGEIRNLHKQIRRLRRALDNGENRNT